MSEKPPEKMTFVYLKNTRQVLAAATREAVPSTAVKTGSETEEQLAANAANELKVLVGDELLVRNLLFKILPLNTVLNKPDLIPAGIRLPATELAVITLDLKPSEFKDSRKYFIDDDNKPKVSAEPTFTITAGATEVSVLLSAKTPIPLNVTVWVYRNDRTKLPILLESSIPKDVDPPQCVMPVGLETGDYQFLILVQSYKPAVHEKTI